jgi:hypothetical protein
MKILTRTLVLLPIALLAMAMFAVLLGRGATIARPIVSLSLPFGHSSWFAYFDTDCLILMDQSATINPRRFANRLVTSDPTDVHIKGTPKSLKPPSVNLPQLPPRTWNEWWFPEGWGATDTLTLGSETTKIRFYVSEDFYMVPIWIPAVAAVLPLLVAAVVTFIRRRRANQPKLNLCPVCHYDLRASTDRCPECGTPIGTPPPPRWRSLLPQSPKRAVIMLACIALLAMVVYPLVQWLSNTDQRVRERCLANAMNLTAPSQRVVYEEDPNLGKALAPTDANYLQEPMSPWYSLLVYRVPALQRLAALDRDIPIYPLYAGGRRAPGSHIRLVTVSRGSFDNGSRAYGAPGGGWIIPWPIDWSISTSEDTWRGGDWVKIVQVPDVANPPATFLRCYAGQNDPNDESHFTIAFTCAGKPGILDGYLINDQTLTIKARDIVKLP